MKLVLDGTPLERLMWLRAPYADRATLGRPNFDALELRTFFEQARGAGLQPMIHAVGDAAIDAVLGGLERTGAEAWRDLRPRIEHGDLLAPDQHERARRLAWSSCRIPLTSCCLQTAAPRQLRVGLSGS